MDHHQYHIPAGAGIYPYTDTSGAKLCEK